MAIGPDIIIATVLLATAISTMDTRAAMPSSPDFSPFANLLIFEIIQFIPPSLLTIFDKPPIRSDNKNISNIPVKPSHIVWDMTNRSNPFFISKRRAERTIPPVKTKKTFAPVKANTSTNRYGIMSKIS